MEAILKSLAGLALLFVRGYSFCFVLARFWAWSAVEVLHMPPVGLAHVLACLSALDILRTDVRVAWRRTNEEEWAQTMGFSALELAQIWIAFGGVWLVRWWLAP
jgi:hypothetical protein